jgi:hypothetical protein
MIKGIRLIATRLQIAQQGFSGNRQGRQIDRHEESPNAPGVVRRNKLAVDREALANAKRRFNRSFWRIQGRSDRLDEMFGPAETDFIHQSSIFAKKTELSSCIGLRLGAYTAR